MVLSKIILTYNAQTPLYSGCYLRWTSLPPTEVGVFKILLKNLFQKVTADFVGMWESRRLFQGIVGSVGKSTEPVSPRRCGKLFHTFHNAVISTKSLFF